MSEELRRRLVAAARRDAGDAPETADLSPADASRVLSIYAGGDPIGAIRLYRELTGAELGPAHRAVETMVRATAPTPRRPTTADRSVGAIVVPIRAPVRLHHCRQCEATGARRDGRLDTPLCDRCEREAALPVDERRADEERVMRFLGLVRT